MSNTTKNLSWPIGIVASLIVFSGFILFMGYYLSSMNVNLVSDDYYAQSVDYQSTITHLNAAEALSAKPTIELVDNHRVVKIAFPESYCETISTGSIFFLRPDGTVSDISIPITTNAKGVQLIDASILKHGFWKVRLQWEMSNLKYEISDDFIL